MTFKHLALFVAPLLLALLIQRPAAACDTDQECDDGIFCNGVEACVTVRVGLFRTDRRCRRPNGPACQGAQVCREDLDRCVTPCASNAECSDGLFCNGAERCLAIGAPGASINGCAAGALPCPEGRACYENTDSCQPPCPDRDGDGYEDGACGGLDCDDFDRRISPGATEVCDPDGVDEDCDPFTIGDRDADRDGFVDQRCCNGERCGLDCDDFTASVNPLSVEACNNVDDDCDGSVDEGVRGLFFTDNDRDGYGDVFASPVYACFPEPGLAPNHNDCDDHNPAIVPGAMRCLDQSLVQVEICGSDGGWQEPLTCDDAGQFPGGVTGNTCYAQPNGTGVCGYGRSLDFDLDPPRDNFNP